MPRIETIRLIPLRAIVPLLLVLAPALPAVETPAPVPRKKLSAVSVLPTGSKLQNVMFPRYDPEHHLLGMLKAREMTLVDDETIAGEVVHIESFNSDGSLRGQVDMVRTVFNQVKGLMNTRDPVVIHTDRFNAIGTGLCYFLNQNNGYLIGPVITWIHNPPENAESTETSMNTSPSPLRTTAGLAMSLLTLPLTAAVPPPVSNGELATIHEEAAPTTSFLHAGAAKVTADLAKDTRDAAAATKTATSFIADAGIPVPDTDPPVPAPEPKPLDVKPAPGDTVITCDGGMYFDDDKGVLVYLKNVHVVDPRFDLSGANELKIFLEKKAPENPSDSAHNPGDKPAPEVTPKPGTTPAKPGDKPAPNDPLGGGFSAKFGDVDHIVANGAVRFHQKQPEPGKEPIDASGSIFTYHANTGQIIISGGYPWVQQGPTYMRAEQPNLNLRILKSGAFNTEGKWTMFGPLKQDDKPKHENPPKANTPPKKRPRRRPPTV